MLILRDVSRAAGRVRPRCSSAIETCLALWVARAPEREPLATSARRIEQQMRPGMRAEVAELDRIAPGWPLRLLEAMYATGACEIEVAAERLRRPSGRPLRVNAFTLPSADGRRYQVTPPELLATRALDAALGYWQVGFGAVWARQEQTLSARHAWLAEHLTDDPGGTLAHLSPRAIHDAGDDRLSIVGCPARSIECDALSALDVVPSMWLQRRVILGFAPGRVAVCVGVRPSIGAQLGQVARRLGSLGDSRRLLVLLLCMAQPRTTQELARELNVTESAISRHLHELKSQNFVYAQREGRYVLYSGIPEELALVGVHIRRLLSEALSLADPRPLAADQAKDDAG